MSRDLSFYYDTLLEFRDPVHDHDFVLQCAPASFPGQEITECRLTVEPASLLIEQADGFGNHLRVGRIEEEHSSLHYRVEGTARIDFSKRAQEACAPMYRFPSAYTVPSPEMLEFLASLDLPEDPVRRAWSLGQAVHNYMEYAPGATGIWTTAKEAFAAKKGVCQDFAHIFLALARADGMPARYANGLPEGSGATHAWCEVWIDGKWIGVDPTRCRMTDEGYIRIGVGRDYGDCPMERGIFRSPSDQTQTVFMKVEPLSDQ